MLKGVWNTTTAKLIYTCLHIEPDRSDAGNK